MNLFNLAFQNRFLDNLIKKTSIPGEDGLEIRRQELLPVLQQRILLHIYKHLKESDRELLGSLLITNQIVASKNMIENKIPFLDNLIKNVFVEFEEEYVKLMAD